VSPNSVLSKTQKGTEEIATRQNKLDARLRALLIMVNGTATAGGLAQKFGAENAAAMLQQLLTQGFIEESAAAGTAPAGGADKLKQAQREICSSLSEMLGPDADAVTEKIEACNTLADVRAFLEMRRGMLNEWMGKAKSAQFWAKVDAALR